MKTGNKKSLTLAAIALFVLVAAFAAVYFYQRPAAELGSKTVQVVVVAPEATTVATYQTDAEFLGAILQDETCTIDNTAGLTLDIVGSDSEYGFYIEGVMGYNANTENQEWWCVTKGGEMVTTGIDATPIADGDTFEITLMTGW